MFTSPPRDALCLSTGLPAVSPPCQHCGMRHQVLFSDLQSEELSLIRQTISKLDIAPGKVLYRFHGEPAYIYTVRRGLIKLRIFLPNGNQRILRLVWPTEVAGIEALSGKTYFHDAVALEPTAVCRIPVGVIASLNRHSPNLYQPLMERWQQTLQDANFFLEQLATGTSQGRVARLLLYLANNSHNQDFFLPNREDIKAMLALTTETVSRIVAEYRRKDVLRMTGINRASFNGESSRQILEQQSLH